MTQMEEYFHRIQFGPPFRPREAMKYEAIRLTSFKTWPTQSQQNPTTLASAGFSYNGYRDEVLCFACGGRIKNWQPHFNPMNEHRKYFPKCPLVRGISDNVPMSVSIPPGFSSADTLDIIKPTGACSNLTINPLSDQTNLDKNKNDSMENNTVESITGQTREDGTNKDESTLNTLNQASQTNRESTDSVRTRPPIARITGSSPDYWDIDQRIASYLGWPRNVPIHPEELATAGFYYTNVDDMVQCFTCKGRLRNWEVGNSAIGEHRKYYPNCQFLAQVDYDNQQMGRRPTRSSSRTSDACQQTSSPRNGTDRNNRLLSGQDDDSPIVTARPKHGQFAIESRRLATFDTWPSDKEQTPEELSEAGFFYAGFNDNVKCFFCDGGLRNWDPPDKPWEEHARWFSKCGYVKQCKGMAFIRQFANKRKSESHDASRHEPDIIPSRTAEAFMDSPAVKAILDMEYSRDLVREAVSQMLQQSDVRSLDALSATELLDKVFELEEGATMMKEGNDTSVECLTNETSGFHEMSLTENNTITSPDKESCTTSENSEKSRLKQEYDTLKNQYMCKICFERENNVLILPCAHLVCCTVCIPALRNCPMCRGPIKDTVRTYIP